MKTIEQAVIELDGDPMNPKIATLPSPTAVLCFADGQYKWCGSSSGNAENPATRICTKTEFMAKRAELGAVGVDLASGPDETVVMERDQTGWVPVKTPLVGTVCEFRRFKEAEWRRCEVIGRHGEWVWLLVNGAPNSWKASTVEFQPLQSHREKVAREAV